MVTDNITTNQSCENVMDFVTFRITNTAIFSVFLFSSLVGNSLVPVIVFKKLELHSSTNYIISNMSIADLLFSLIMFPLRIREMYLDYPYQWPMWGAFSSVLCKLVHFLVETSTLVIAFSLVIVSVQRYIAVKHPFKTNIFQAKFQSVNVIIATWALSMLFSSHMFYIHRHITDNRMSKCIASWYPAFDDSHAKKIEELITKTLFLIIPSLIIIYIYSAVIVFLRKKKHPGRITTPQKLRKERNNRQITYMLLTDAAAFFVPSCAVTVFLAINFNFSNKLSCGAIQLLNYVLLCLSYVHPACSPYIYCAFNAKYREGFKDMLCCVCFKLRSFNKTRQENQQQ